MNTNRKSNKIIDLYRVENIDEKNAEIIKKNNQKRKMEEIIKIIEKEPELLKKLDIPKLEMIDNYYKEKIAEYKKKLSKPTAN